VHCCVLGNFEAVVILLAFKDKYSRASCDCNSSLNMEKMAIILQMMAILSKVVITMFAMAQAWALMLLLSVCFLAF
jgi:hypothetical protein